MGKLTWLHISDLHLNKNGVETIRLREQLPKYLQGLGIHYDYVFCTGDLRYAPMGDFAESTHETIRDLCEAVKVPIDRFFVAPGNHDVNRDVAGRDSSIRNLWFKQDDVQTGYYNPSEGLINHSDLVQIMRGTQNYEAAMRSVLEAQINSQENHIKAFGPHKVIETIDLNVVILDSTVTYTKYQERDLIIGTYYLQETLKACNNEKTTIILTHYSFDYLNRSEQEIILALLRDYNVQLWFAGHEHRNLARKQRDYFYEFQCGNLLLENNARSCIIIGEFDTKTHVGQIQVHAWFSPDGWALYPFVCAHSDYPSIYPFNISANIVELASQKLVLRQRLRAKITPILLENQNIFETYGPTDNNRNTLRSELSIVWEKMLREKIIPNSFQIIDLLKSQQFLLSESEISTLGKYEMHIHGLKENHSGTGQFKLNAPMFPTEIMRILE